MNLKETGKFIACRRKELGLTQEKLARSVKVTAKAVSKWEIVKMPPHSLALFVQ